MQRAVDERFNRSRYDAQRTAEDFVKGLDRSLGSMMTDGKYREIRERYERFHNPLWGQQPQSPGGFLLQRYLLFGDLHLGENVRIFSELMS